MNLADAVRKFVRDGWHISFGGFTVNRQPMTVAYEIIRQGIASLHVYMHSGGQALDPLIGVGRIITFVQHERRRFVERLDYLTTPGYPDGPGGRERAGDSHGGPVCVISDKALLRFDNEQRTMSGSEVR